MANFKFNIDPKDLRDEQIMRHKDFGKVMQNYQRMTHPLYRTPLYRYRKILVIVILILIVAWLVAEFGDVEKKKETAPKDELHQLNQ